MEIPPALVLREDGSTLPFEKSDTFGVVFRCVVAQIMFVATAGRRESSTTDLAFVLGSSGVVER